MNNKKIAIIGGGLGGLSLGYFLSKAGNKVIIFEKENYVGGLMSGFKMEGSNLERTYHHFFKTDKYLIALINELGLEKSIVWNKSSTAIYWKKKMHSFNGAIDLLKFGPLSLVDKFRMGLAAVYLGLDNNWQKYEDKTAVEWVKKYMGKNGYEVVWKPLLKGKFHRFYKDISMAWLWARIHTRGGSKNEKGEEVLGYIDDGFDKLTQELVKRITKNNGEIILKSQIDSKRIKELERKYDFVVDTRPDKEIDYLAAIDVVFSSEQNLSQYYWHNINDPKSPFIAFIQHTNLVGVKNYKGKNIYYLGTYVPQDHRFLKIDEEKLVTEWFDYLKTVFPKFDKTLAKNISVFRFRHAQQIVTRNYKKPVEKVSNKIYKMNFAQIYPEDRGVNFAVREAERMARNFIL